MMQTQQFTIAGLKKIYKVKSDDKKKMRWNLTKRFSNEKLPLHSCLAVKDNQGILICGAHASGKSTLSQYLVSLGYKIQANDFVIAWENKGKIFAGDLNFAKENVNKHAIEITKCIFLIPNDIRDVFQLRQDEVKNFYFQIMQPCSKTTSQKFTKSKIFDMLIQKHVCLGHRISPTRWQRSIVGILNQNNPTKIGIIGVGIVGQDIANLILDIPEISRLNLFSECLPEVTSITLDLKSGKPNLEIIPHKTSRSCIENSDILIFSFRSLETPNTKKVQERYKKLDSHSKIIWDYSRLLRSFNYKGIVLIVTNPTDMLSNLMYLYSNINNSHKFDWKGLLSNQVYAIGLGLDHARLKTINNTNLEIIGEHGEHQWLAKPIKNKLTFFNNAKLLKQVKSFSEKIRIGGCRTRFGPSHEVSRVIKILVSNSNETLRVSTLGTNGYFWSQPIKLDNLTPSEIYKLDTKLSTNIKHLQQQYQKTIHTLNRITFNIPL